MRRIGRMLDEREKILGVSSSDPRVNRIRNEVLLAIKRDLDVYPAEFVIETLTRFGDAPQLVYDDNGMFAVSGTSYSGVVVGRQRLNGVITVSVEKRQWSPTVRGALKKYVHSMKKIPL